MAEQLAHIMQTMLVFEFELMTAQAYKFGVKHIIYGMPRQF